MSTELPDLAAALLEALSAEAVVGLPTSTDAASAASAGDLSMQARCCACQIPGDTICGCQRWPGDTQRSTFQRPPFRVELLS